LKPRALFFAIFPVLVGMLTAPSGFARSKAIPDDVDGFTEDLAGRFAKALPDRTVKVVGPLALEIGPPAKGDQVSLQRPWDYCQRERRQCAREVKDYVAEITGTIEESGAPTQASNIRVIVRGPGYVEQMRQIAANKPEAEGIVRPVAGGLSLICVVDAPHGVKTLEKGDLAALGLSEDQAIALGIKNVAAALKPLDQDTHIFPKLGVKFATGDFYESSRMLLHDDWAEMSKAMNGHLVVAAPSSDVLVFGNGGGNGDRIVLAGFVRTIAEMAPKPLSATLFHWTATGWEVAKPE
jgi:hypothetical protein